MSTPADLLRDYAARQGLTGEDLVYLLGLLREAVRGERDRCLGAARREHDDAVKGFVGPYKMGRRDAATTIREAIESAPEP